jgi:transcriptional regulator with XRE-family HTH domain
MTFSEQLTAAVQRSGLTQPAAADLLGIKPRTLWNWLHGKTVPHGYMQQGSLATLAASESFALSPLSAMMIRLNNENDDSQTYNWFEGTQPAAPNDRAVKSAD